MSKKSKYWILFDSLNNSLINSGKIEISIELEDAKKYVTGLTDGWYEFLNGLNEVENKFYSKMNEKEQKKLKKLINQLENSLQ